MKPLTAVDPTVVGPYRLLGVLGGGGMSKVYLGRSATGRRLAIKVVRAELAEDPSFRQRFAREVVAARSVSPLFTAAVVDADTDAEAPWLATTFIDGPSLLRWVTEHGLLSLGATLTLGAGLAEALASIHRVGLIHRDLKPSNVLLDDSGPHIIDFGIALATGATRMTTSLMLGTPSYMAPERLHDDDAGAASDVFALGATLVFAVTGRSLVHDGTMYQQILQITLGRFDLTAVPRQLRPLVARCLSKHPKDRPTAAELARILVAAGVPMPVAGWYRTESATEPVVSLPAAGRALLRRRRVFALGGVLGVAAVGGAVAFAAGVFERPGNRPAFRGSVTPQAGSVLWQARSGTRPFGGGGPGAKFFGEHIVVDRGTRIIATDGAQVYAVNVKGSPVWTRTLPGGVLELWLWRDMVLVKDPRQLWGLDAATGGQRFVRNLVEDEERAARDDNPDNHPVEISRLAVAAERAYVGLGTATIAIDPTGTTVWRSPRPPVVDGQRPPAGNPLVADAERLVTEDAVGDLAHVGLRSAKDAERRWTVTYDEPPDQGPPGPPPPPGNGRPPGPGGGPDGPPPDRAWRRSEGRIGSAYLALRDAQEVRVLRLTDGGTAWERSSPTPVAAMDFAGELVLVAADRLSAYAVANGATAWQAAIRGARLAVITGGVLCVDEQSVTVVDLTGATRWQARLPESVTNGAMPDRLTVDGQVAYVTFHPRGDRREPLDIDVLAIALS